MSGKTLRGGRGAGSDGDSGLIDVRSDGERGERGKKKREKGVQLVIYFKDSM